MTVLRPMHKGCRAGQSAQHTDQGFRVRKGFDTAAALSQVTGLEELHKIAGDDCYLLKVRAAGTDELNAIIEEQINPVQSVTRVRTTIVLNSVTERSCLAGHDIVALTRG